MACGTHAFGAPITSASSTVRRERSSPYPAPGPGSIFVTAQVGGPPRNELSHSSGTRAGLQRDVRQRLSVRWKLVVARTQRRTVTRKKVAGIEVLLSVLLL